MMRSKKATEYIKAVAYTIKPTIENVPAGGLSGRLSVEFYVYTPDRRRRDIDNLSKGLLDSMQYAGIYIDDNQVDRLLIVREPEIGGYVDVRITEI